MLGAMLSSGLHHTIRTLSSCIKRSPCVGSRKQDPRNKPSGSDQPTIAALPADRGRSLRQRSSAARAVLVLVPPDQNIQTALPDNMQQRFLCMMLMAVHFVHMRPFHKLKVSFP